MRLAGSRQKFSQHGESGHAISGVLPHLTKVADELCIVYSLHTDEINHAPAQIFLHTGFGRGGRPSFGSWVTYGLGSENQDLPAYVVLQSGTTGGRDHHKDAFTFWLAGGGIRGGVSYGKTDEFGFGVTEKPVHVHDLNATVLHLLGLDHERLTFKYQGREFRLTDIGGHVMTDLLV